MHRYIHTCHMVYISSASVQCGNTWWRCVMWAIASNINGSILVLWGETGIFVFFGTFRLTTLKLALIIVGYKTNPSWPKARNSYQHAPGLGSSQYKRETTELTFFFSDWNIEKASWIAICTHYLRKFGGKR